jgi:hypothetical protein
MKGHLLKSIELVKSRIGTQKLVMCFINASAIVLLSNSQLALATDQATRGDGPSGVKDGGANPISDKAIREENEEENKENEI